MKLHLLYKSIASTGKPAKIPGWFEGACQTLGVEFVGYDYSQRSVPFLGDLPTLGTGDLLYRSAVSHDACIAERMLINDQCAHFYDHWQGPFRKRVASWFIHMKEGIPVIPSFPMIPRKVKERARVVEALGGFPVIVKALGGSLGVGVMRIDSQKSLNSVLDYFLSINTAVLLRKYIKHDHYVRSVVVGDKVVASHAGYVVDGEFRTNTTSCAGQELKPVKLSPEDEQIVVRAVHSLGLETGGVDLLFDAEGKSYVTEVNYPNNFTETQKVTGIDIAKHMVEYLIQKAEQKK